MELKQTVRESTEPEDRIGEGYVPRTGEVITKEQGVTVGESRRNVQLKTTAERIPAFVGKVADHY